MVFSFFIFRVVPLKNIPYHFIRPSALLMKISLFLLLILLPAAGMTEESPWVTVEGVAPLENTTKNNARQMAINDARRKAVEQVVGVNLLSQTLVINHRTAGDVVCTLPYGKVIDQEIIHEEVETTPAHGKGEAPFLTYKVKARIQVFKEKGRSDPYFQVSARMNRTEFKHGDDMQIRITPTRDAYIMIFNILEDERVLILYPNRYFQKNFVKAGTTFVFPDVENHREGIRLVATLDGNRSSSNENIYILATREPMVFDTAKYSEGIFGVYDGTSALVCDLVRKTVSIPLSERAEQFLPYRIVR